jgi:hypothetical protein
MVKKHKKKVPNKIKQCPTITTETLPACNYVTLKCELTKNRAFRNKNKRERGRERERGGKGGEKNKKTRKEFYMSKKLQLLLLCSVV